MSWWISALVPPRPQTTTGPKCGSVLLPTSISTPPGDHRLHEEALHARGRGRRGARSISSAAAATAAAPTRPRRTAPTSVLWTIPDATAFSATGRAELPGGLPGRGRAGRRRASRPAAARSRRRGPAMSARREPVGPGDHRGRQERGGVLGPGVRRTRAPARAGSGATSRSGRRAPARAPPPRGTRTPAAPRRPDRAGRPRGRRPTSAPPATGIARPQPRGRPPAPRPPPRRPRSPRPGWM